MKITTTRTAIATTLLAATLALSACSAEQAVDNTVGLAAGTTKVVAKGAVGAGKLVYKGGKAIADSNE